MKVLNATGCEIYNTSIIKGDHCFVMDNRGKKYLDFESGVWVLPLGHNNKRINKAITKQLGEIIHTGYRYTHPVVEDAAETLLNIMNLEKGKCLFLSAGSEAVEFALKIVKKISNKPYLLNLDKHYLSAYGISGDTKSSNWISIDWQSHIGDDSINVDSLLKDIPFDEIGAFIFEPGNASGNVQVPPKELITAIVSKIKEHKGWIVIDEVTTGIGRTGKWFGFEHFDIQPDIIACGKGLGNGYPISAIGISDELCELLEKTDFVYGQSHQNDPLGCAVAKEVITVIGENHLLEKSTENGVYLKNKLLYLNGKYSFIKEVRGLGLMCAIEFDDSIDSQLLTSIHRQLYEAGFIVGLKIITNVIRFYPPLIIENYMIDDMINAFDKILLYI